MVSFRDSEGRVEESEGGAPRPSSVASFLVICISVAVAIVASYVISRLWPVSSDPVTEAKELGIVSITVLRGYPKHMEVIYYLVFLTVIPALSIASWYVFRALATSGAKLKPGFEGGDVRIKEFKRTLPTSVFILIAVVSAYLYYSKGYLTSDWIGPWYLFSEQGENISWASAILSGKVLYKDTFCLYGPLMEYPLAFIMERFGETVYNARLYSLGTYMLAAAVISVISFATSRSRLQALLTALVILAFYFPVKQSVNATPLRMMLGILACFHIYRYAATGKRGVLFAAGIITGIAFLYSPEKGMAVLMAAAVFVGLAVLIDIKEIRLRVEEVLIFLGGFLLTLAPVIYYFYSTDALMPFLNNIADYSRYVMLGYDSLPAPDLIANIKGFLSGRDSFKVLAFGIAFYLPVLIYALTLLFVGLEYLKGRLTPLDVFALMLTLYAIVTFRSALGRSDGFHLVQVYAPAFFLLSYLATLHLKHGASRLRAVVVFVILFALPLSFVMTNFNAAAPKKFITMNTVGAAVKFSPVVPRGFVESSAPEMAGIYIPPGSARTIDGLKAFKGMIKETDEVYVFGNVPLFYFLLGKQNPTRYDYPYWAVTKEIQREIIGDLKRKRPLYMLYKMDRVDMVDNIQPFLRLPLLYGFLMENYSLESRVTFPGFKVYVIKGSKGYVR